MVILSQENSVMQGILNVNWRAENKLLILEAILKICSLNVIGLSQVLIRLTRNGSWEQEIKQRIGIVLAKITMSTTDAIRTAENRGAWCDVTNSNANSIRTFEVELDEEEEHETIFSQIIKL